MLTQTILDALTTKALQEAGPSRSDVLPALVDWIAARAQALTPEEMDLMMNVSLVLYKHELEKNWHVTAATVETERSTGNDAKDVATPAVSLDESDNAKTTAAIDAMVAMRRTPESPNEVTPTSNVPRRRWTDNPCWSLTIR